MVTCGDNRVLRFLVQVWTVTYRVGRKLDRIVELSSNQAGYHIVLEVPPIL
jgi:hypothetical protein